MILKDLNFSKIVEDDYASREQPRFYTVFFKIADAIKNEWFVQDRFLFKEDKEGYAYFEFLCSDTASDFYHKLKHMNIYVYTNFMVKTKQ